MGTNYEHADNPHHEHWLDGLSDALFPTHTYAPGLREGEALASYDAGWRMDNLDPALVTEKLGLRLADLLSELIEGLRLLHSKLRKKK